MLEIIPDRTIFCFCLCKNDDDDDDDDDATDLSLRRLF